MIDANENYKIWCNKCLEDIDLRKELDSIIDNQSEINERFYKNLEFGTGGLRGIIGAGTNRVNIYSIRKVTQGLSNYLKNNFEKPSVAIAYDSRIKSDVFAKNAAGVLAANDIDVYIYDELMPTPFLSFAVRNLKCSSGIVITASHNPAKYNGYKVYGDDGCQITLDMANRIFDEIEKVDIFNDVKYIEFDCGMKNEKIHYISHTVLDEFIDAVSNESLLKNDNMVRDLKIVYTPLNGAGLRCVTSVLNKNKFNSIKIVSEQKEPDGNFTTCPYPNPEIKDALLLGLNLAKSEDADILLATDPDCDRIGIAIKNNNEYSLLNGNQVGILLFDFICKMRIKNNNMPKNPIVIKTIVTTDMLVPLAKHYNVEIIDVLTGFKFIGEQIGYLEQKGQQDRYIFGFEESYGYLSGGYVRDKDGVNAALLICEMTQYYKNQNKTLIDVLNELYDEYGYYVTSLVSIDFEGISGFKKMQDIMHELRNYSPNKIINKKVIEKCDYKLSVRYDSNYNKSDIRLPKSDIMKFVLEGNNSVVIRPSGTEPKLKLYYFAQGISFNKANEFIKQLDIYFKDFIK